MEVGQILLTYGGVSIPIGGLVWFLFKKWLDTIEMHRAMMVQNNKFIEARISVLETQLEASMDANQKMTILINEFKSDIAILGVKLEVTENLIDKHDQTLHEMLPKIQTEIGKLSMYFKKP